MKKVKLSKPAMLKPLPLPPPVPMHDRDWETARRAISVGGKVTKREGNVIRGATITYASFIDEVHEMTTEDWARVAGIHDVRIIHKPSRWAYIRDSYAKLHVSDDGRIHMTPSEVAFFMRGARVDKLFGEDSFPRDEPLMRRRVDDDAVRIPTSQGAFHEIQLEWPTEQHERNLTERVFDEAAR